MHSEEHSEIPKWLTEMFPPQRVAAVDNLRPLVDEEMLRDIARADFGQGSQKHYAALEPSGRTGRGWFTPP